MQNYYLRPPDGRRAPNSASSRSASARWIRCGWRNPTSWSGASCRSNMPRSNPGSSASSISTRAISSAATRCSPGATRAFANRLVTLEVHGVTDADARGSEPVMPRRRLGRAHDLGRLRLADRQIAGAGDGAPGLRRAGDRARDPHSRRGEARGGYCRQPVRSRERGAAGVTPSLRAERSNPWGRGCKRKHGLLRRSAPRNDDPYASATLLRCCSSAR